MFNPEIRRPEEVPAGQPEKPVEEKPWQKSLREKAKKQYEKEEAERSGQGPKKGEAKKHEFTSLRAALEAKRIEGIKPRRKTG
jgi:hypothetical protein